jgi:hypothetical protein
MKLSEAFSEVHNNPPRTLKKGQSKAKREAQLRAIAYSKAGKK